METIDIYTRVATIIHLLGVILGVGTATITDILFFKFIRDKHISSREAKLMDELSKIIWVALIILIVSGVALYVPNMERLDQSGKFLTKLIGILVLVLNGLMLSYIIRPKLTKIDFSNNHMSRFGLSHIVNRRMRIWATICGAVSISSWYYIFVLGALRGITFPLQTGIFIYGIILIIAIIGSLIFENGAYQKLQHRIHEGHYKEFKPNHYR